MIGIEVLDELRAIYPQYCSRHELRDTGHFLIYPGSLSLGPAPTAMFDLQMRLADMDAAIQAASRHPDRLPIFPTVRLPHPGATTKEINRMAARTRVRGVQTGTNIPLSRSHA